MGIKGFLIPLHKICKQQKLVAFEIGLISTFRIFGDQKKKLFRTTYTQLLILILNHSAQPLPDCETVPEPIEYQANNVRKGAQSANCQIQIGTNAHISKKRGGEEKKKAGYLAEGAPINFSLLFRRHMLTWVIFSVAYIEIYFTHVPRKDLRLFEKGR